MYLFIIFIFIYVCIYLKTYKSVSISVSMVPITQGILNSDRMVRDLFPVIYFYIFNWVVA